jgi:DNA-binding NtrC family response regulator
MTKRALILLNSRRRRSQLRRMLKRRFIPSEAPENYPEAKEMIAGGKYFLIFADPLFHGLPVKELYRIASRRDGVVNYLVPVTGKANIRTGLALLKRGAIDCLMKPFSRETVEMVVEKALNLRSISTELEVMRKEIESRNNSAGAPEAGEKSNGISEIPLEKIADEKLASFMKKVNIEKVKDLHTMVMDTVERPLIRQVLERTKWNQVKASTILGINRNTLRKKISELRLSPEKHRLPRRKKSRG